MGGKAAAVLRKGEIGILLACGVSATLIMFCNAVGRYVFSTTMVWAEEAVRILFVWSMFIAITDSFIRNQHIGFDNLAKMNAKTKFVCDIVYALAMLAVGGTLAYYGSVYNTMTGGVPLPSTNLPTAILMIPGILAGFSWTAVGLVRTIKLAASLFAGARKGA